MVRITPDHRYRHLEVCKIRITFAGRIYIPSSCFSRGLHAFASVRIRALYTGAFEDVPWSALSIEVLGDDDEIRKTNAQLLITDDQWVVC